MVTDELQTKDLRTGDPPVLAAHPFVRWAGGKKRLLPELLKRVPDGVRTYYEPMVGSGALFYALASAGRIERAVLGDLSPEVALAHEVVRFRVDELVDCLTSMAEKHCPEFYHEVRDVSPEVLALYTDVAKVARFVYLNKTCFNGLYRVNKRGMFNVPMDRGRLPEDVCDADLLRRCSVVLRKYLTSAVACYDFAVTTASASPDDFVYLDPPYVPLTKTASFTAFTKEGFGLADHLRLAVEATRLRDRGVRGMLSSSDNPEVRRIYEFCKFKVEELKTTRSMSCRGDGRGVHWELLVSW